MQLTGILLVGFLGFIVQLLTQISTRFSWFEQETNKTKNIKQLISIIYGEVIDIDKSCYGWSPSYQDVRDLRKFADLEREFLEQKGLWEEFKKFKEDKEAEICSG